MAARRPAAQVLLDRSTPSIAPAPSLDPQQRLVTEHRAGALLVLAGPGTGKTTTLVEAMIARLSGPVSPLPATAVLGLTFGRRAALEWRDRVAARIPTGPVPDIQTFHSFAYSVVRRFGALDLYAPRPRVGSSADQLTRIREMLADPVRNHEWAGEWARAIPTIGFATELQELISRARSLGLEPRDLIGFAGEQENPTWRSAGLFLAEYLDVIDAAGVLDYAELIERARALLRRPDVSAELQGRYRAIFVDEYQDTDAAAQELLRDLVGAGTSLVVVGDPDQSIYAFRGANRKGLFDFRPRFAAGSLGAGASAGGSPAGGGVPTIVLSQTRRFGPVIRAGATRVLHNSVIPGLTTTEVIQHRNPECAVGAPGAIEVCTFDSEGAQAAFVADALRRAHLGPGAEIPWSQMAVLVRSGTRSIPTLRRALGLAGVPIEVAGDEMPLRQEAAVAALLGAVELSLRPLTATADEVKELLVGPLGQLDPSELRSFARALRVRARELAGPGAPIPGSDELVREAFVDPSEIATMSGVGADCVRRLRKVIDNTASAQTAGPYQVLWELWSGTDWPDRLERDSLAGGPRGRRADRDLDSVCALFDLAAREDERLVGHKGVRSFLFQVAAQDIPTEPGTAPTVRGTGVRLLTAHRAKGLEWTLVVCYGVQDRDWPDLRVHGSLLAAEKLGTEQLAEQPARSELLAEERRLFYVGCTRARERLLVTAVAGGSDDVIPSRFLTDLAGPAPDAGQTSTAYPGVTRRHESGRIPRPLSMSGLVAGLRTAATSGSPALQGAAVERLARLALEVDSTGAPVVPAAAPDSWWGVLAFTAATTPVRPSGPVSLSASQVTAYLDCPLAWFLGHEAGGRVGRNSAMGFGSVLHAVVAAVTDGEIAADAKVIDNLLDKWWGQLGYEAKWHAAAERRAASDAVAAFLRWDASHQTRPALAAEASFEFVVAVPGDEVLLRGSVDRIEQLGVDQAHVVDFKTGKNLPTKVDTEANIQLAIYQLAVAEVAIEATRERVPQLQPGGAELVFLRETDAAGLPKSRSQTRLQIPTEESGPADVDDLADPPPIASRAGILAALAEVANGIRVEAFPARPETSMCANCDVRLACPAVAAGQEVPL